MGFVQRVAALSLAVMSTAAIGFLRATPAAAHDELLRSSPRDGAVLAALPSVVTLTFEEPPADGFTSMSVTGPNGVRANTAGPQTNGAMVTEQLVENGRAGRYVIAYRIMSDDGHPVAGTVRFTVRSGTATTRDVEQSGPVRTGSSAALGAIAGVTVFGVLAFAALRFRRRRS